VKIIRVARGGRFLQTRKLGVQLGSSTVAQNCILLYRGFAIRRPRKFEWRREWRHLAECNSAIRQITNLRYVNGVIRGNYSDAHRSQTGQNKDCHEAVLCYAANPFFGGTHAG
jgi:hypothetical protein